MVQLAETTQSGMSIWGAGGGGAGRHPVCQVLRRPAVVVGRVDLCPEGEQQPSGLERARPVLRRRETIRCEVIGAVVLEDGLCLLHGLWWSSGMTWYLKPRPKGISRAR